MFAIQEETQAASKDSTLFSGQLSQSCFDWARNKFETELHKQKSRKLYSFLTQNATTILPVVLAFSNVTGKEI